jgi:hypothetical protein
VVISKYSLKTIVIQNYQQNLVPANKKSLAWNYYKLPGLTKMS